VKQSYQLQVEKQTRERRDLRDEGFQFTRHKKDERRKTRKTTSQAKKMKKEGRTEGRVAETMPESNDSTLWWKEKALRNERKKKPGLKSSETDQREELEAKPQVHKLSYSGY